MMRAAATRVRSPRSVRDSLLHALLPISGLVVVVGLWQTHVFHRLFGLESYTVPYPSQILSAAQGNASLLWQGLRSTLLEAGGGYALGCGVGFAVAVLLAGWRLGGSTVLGLCAALNAMPIVALAPIGITYLGYGVMSKVAVVGVMTFAAMTVTAYKGLTAVEDSARQLLRSYAATPRAVVTKLLIPNSLPYVFAALKLSVSLALVGAIIAEFFGGFVGLGLSMIQALKEFDAPLAWSAMILIGLVGVLWYFLVSAIEGIVTSWHHSHRTQTP